MLCDVCFRMLRSQEGRIWKGTYDLYFTHHTQEEDLQRSAKMNCGICRVLSEELKQKRLKTDPALEIDKEELSVTASLAVLDHPRVHDLYRLDFKLRCGRTRYQRTFILKRTSE